MDFKLRDCDDDCSEVVDGKVTIEKGNIGLLIKVRGYGDHDSQDGHGCPIILERLNGRLRLVVYNDINDEEPQIIDLEGARESERLSDHIIE